MKNITQSITITMLVALLAGCASGAAYQQKGWANSTEHADWDIDSAICLQRSEQLTEEDQQRIVEIKQNAALVGDALSSAGDTLSVIDDDYGYLGAFGGLFSGSKSATAEEQMQQEKFTKCMNEKNWEKG
ncbi:hypothetical protein [Candidatus Spongiihabitans sp.]|uniref:hypothetical protein n=1 Tax=Candidatus Spongiihabitans sp. TaxID=3101308 RepID=UPI003C6F3F3F